MEHLQILDVARWDMAGRHVCLVLLAGEVGRRGDQQSHGAIGDLIVGHQPGVALEDLVDHDGSLDVFVAGDDRRGESLVERGRVVGLASARPELGCGCGQPAPCHRA